MSTETDILPPVASAPEPSSADEFDAAAAEAFANVDAPGTPAAIDDETGKAASADEPPAPAPAAAQTPAADGKASPAGTTPSDDPWAKAPPELRDARQRDLRDADLRLKSVQGRQSAADREVQRLRDQLAEIKRGGTAQPAEQTGGTEPAATPNPTHDKLREDYPEIAGPLLDRIDSLTKAVDGLKAGVGEVQQDRTTAFILRQEALLNEKHPDWMDALGDDRFAGWLQEQPRPVIEAYNRNLKDVVDGPEAAWLVDQWKRSGIYEVKTSTPAPTPTDDRRAKQLQNGRDLGRTAPPATTNEAPDDLDGAAMALFREEQRRARA